MLCQIGCLWDSQINAGKPDLFSEDFIDATTKPKLKLRKISHSMGDSNLVRIVAKAGEIATILNLKLPSGGKNV